MKRIRSKAPLRLGIAGGGTDVSPYSDIYGGCVLNATINMFAHTFLEDNSDKDMVIFEAKDLNKKDEINFNSKDDTNENHLILHRAVYRYVMDNFNDGVNVPLIVTTFSDCPPGSGLGSSSALVVSMLESYKEYFSIPLGEYDVAQLAFEIERNICGFSGGKQDQYAATFGGINFMEFYEEDRVIVNPLRIKQNIISELEASLLLYFVGVSRDSATIINDQVNSIYEKESALKAMHDVKNNAYKIKECLLKGDIDKISKIFQRSWNAKKATSKSISNDLIDKIETEVLSHGAKSIKVSGAGGGGFMMIFIEPKSRIDLIKTLSKHSGYCKEFNFTKEGSYAWRI